MIKIFENDLKKIDLKNVNKLLFQLNPKLKTIDWKRMDRVMKNGHVFSARDMSLVKNNPQGELIGMATLVPITKLAAFFGNVEDMIVFENYRGQGIGKKLMKNIVEKGKKLKMEHLFLTSNPKRKAARAIYKKQGFVEYKTTPFRLFFGE